MIRFTELKEDDSGFFLLCFLFSWVTFGKEMFPVKCIINYSLNLRIWSLKINLVEVGKREHILLNVSWVIEMIKTLLETLIY